MYLSRFCLKSNGYGRLFLFILLPYRLSISKGLAKRHSTTLAQSLLRTPVPLAVPTLPPDTPSTSLLPGLTAAEKRLAALGLAPVKGRQPPSVEVLRQAHAELQDKDIHIGELAAYFFDPSNKLRLEQWEEFFQEKGRATKILNWWVTNNSPTGKAEVHEWAVAYVAGLVGKEAEKVNQAGILRSKKQMDTEQITGFSFQGLYRKLKDEYASVSMRVLRALSHSARQIKEGLSPFRILNKGVVMVTAFTSLMSEFSRSNNLLKRLFGLYLYATGAQRQVLSVLSHTGMAESYSNLTAKASKTRKLPGTLIRLSEFLRETARKVAASGLFGQVYDNINFQDKVGEQTMGRTNVVESGTCSTIWPLHEASAEDMTLKEFNKSFDEALPLTLEDILHTPEESNLFTNSLIHCILRIIVNHGGDGFAKFKDQLQATEPTSDRQIKTHKTPLHPLPAWKIDESTIVGNAEVDAAIVEELQLRNQPTTWMKYVRIIAGDQLSIARLRTLAALRAGNEGGYQGFGWGAWMPGLFHAKMADMHGFFVTHWGKANAGTRNPGCLSFHNTLLRHLPISLTSLPSFRTCRDLVFVSLYARVLHCLLLVSGHKSLAEYCEAVKDWDTLRSHAEKIYQYYASPRNVQGLRDARMRSSATGGDMVLENAILFLRDALISREFTDAVKKGDSGRVLVVLKVLALSYRGNGRSKYAYEMLTFIHNVQKVWPKKIADIILNNWLLNPTGKDNSFVEVDLVQEHMNYWIKVFYKAHGPNSTWEWLGMISPCVYALRHLATAMKKVLGTDIGTRHASVDLRVDIETLMNSLAEHRVYEQVAGRKLDDDDKPVPDIVAEGLLGLVDGTVLQEYNTMFKKLQERRRIRPVTGNEPTEEDAPKDIADATQAPSDGSQPRNLSQNGAQTSPDPSAQVQAAIASHNLTANDAPGTGTTDRADDDSDDGEDETEWRGIRSALEDEEETLPLLTEGDVALDMDEEVVEEDMEEDELDEFGVSVEDVLGS
ncbi:hypothetical protein NMY22_g14542 [Coprinellus aureogranulatus]|nr:hypothetical protein NMY22_g14542 [Coprinellus aureogranulatus]